ncbi:hypothetical protein EB633_21250 [Escherichia coli]|nr:hypothetical protein [Escherichia coli]
MSWIIGTSVYIWWEITPLRASGGVYWLLVGQFKIVRKWYEMVTAEPGEFRQVMAGLQPVVVTSL